MYAYYAFYYDHIMHITPIIHDQLMFIMLIVMTNLCLFCHEQCPSCLPTNTWTKSHWDCSQPHVPIPCARASPPCNNKDRTKNEKNNKTTPNPSATKRKFAPNPFCESAPVTTLQGMVQATVQKAVGEVKMESDGDAIPTDDKPAMYFHDHAADLIRVLKPQNGQSPGRASGSNMSKDMTKICK